jgi:hypothetical protein
MSSNNHPARDAEFLSRLHDGDLSAAERAHFESHRAHCAECRHAAAEFESALSLYRSSRPAPASPDLAGRILRKLQASPGAPRRARFGPSFGIDLRWAGAFAAAVVAAIVGSTIVGRHEAREGLARATAPAPIPVVVQSRPDNAVTPAAPPPPAAKAPSDAPAESAKVSEAPRRSAFSTRGQKKKNEAAAPTEAKEQVAASTEEGVVGGKLTGSEPERQENRTAAGYRERDAAKEKLKAESQPPRMMAQRAAPAPASAAGVVSVILPRLRVEALDGMPAPEITGEVRGLPASLKGRSWVVVVNADGRVRQAREQAALDKRADAAAKDELQPESAPKEILELRFTPGELERRVLVRVE